MDEYAQRRQEDLNLIEVVEEHLTAVHARRVDQARSIIAKRLDLIEEYANYGEAYPGVITAAVEDIRVALRTLATS